MVLVTVLISLKLNHDNIIATVFTINIHFIIHKDDK